MTFFEFSFHELGITLADLGVMMGFDDGDYPEPFRQYMLEAIEAGPELCDIRAGYRSFVNPGFGKEERSVLLEGVLFSPGRIVYSQISGATGVILFIATAGPAISEKVKELVLEGDTVEGYVFDILGSVVAEKAVERLLDVLEPEAVKDGFQFSDPYSPGYCNWDIAEQQKLFSLFPPGFCGVTLSASSLMSPVKSVSGIAGIGAKMKRKGYQCLQCNDDNCIYGRILRSKMPPDS